jgi:hypothetical protein
LKRRELGVEVEDGVLLGGDGADAGGAGSGGGRHSEEPSPTHLGIEAGLGVDLGQQRGGVEPGEGGRIERAERGAVVGLGVGVVVEKRCVVTIWAGCHGYRTVCPGIGGTAGVRVERCGLSEGGDVLAERATGDETGGVPAAAHVSDLRGRGVPDMVQVENQR